MRSKIVGRVVALCFALSVVSFAISVVNAQLVPGVMGGMTSYGGTWIDKDGTTQIKGMISLAASGNFLETPVTTNVSGTPATVLALNSTGRRTALLIEINTANAVVACTDDGSVPALWTHPAITISGQGASINYRDMGLVPAGAIKCIANGSATITVKAS